VTRRAAEMRPRARSGIPLAARSRSVTATIRSGRYVWYFKSIVVMEGCRGPRPSLKLVNCLECDIRRVSAAKTARETRMINPARVLKLLRTAQVFKLLRISKRREARKRVSFKFYGPPRPYRIMRAWVVRGTGRGGTLSACCGQAFLG
jgi:hypothetical protein